LANAVAYSEFIPKSQIIGGSSSVLSIVLSTVKVTSSSASSSASSSSLSSY